MKETGVTQEELMMLHGRALSEGGSAPQSYASFMPRSMRSRKKTHRSKKWRLFRSHVDRKP